jgi:hypothetical protein
MRLRIRYLSIRVATVKGDFGAELPFDVGLNVIRADNSMGKSTALQAIVYGLGIEAILSTSQGVPFPHVMTHSLHTGKEEVPVTESSVLLEFENEKGEVWTTERIVVGQKHKNLVTLHRGALLTAKGGKYTTNDYFVRQPGAAKNEAGFHTKLAEFIGWKLPLVETYDENRVPLYLETIFPLMFIEQKRGWSDIQARFPTQFRIKEVTQRATEFLLALNAYETLLKRRSVEQRSSELVQEWKTKITEAATLTEDENIRVEGLPSLPTVQWPPEGGVRLLIFRDGKWVELEDAQKADREAVKTANQGSKKSAHLLDTQKQLSEAEETLTSVQFAIGRKLDEVEQAEAETERVSGRIKSLETEILRNRDELTLRKLGSLRELSIAGSHCPTCHQGIPDSLIPDLKAEFMTVEQNIEFLKEQREMLKAVLERTQREFARAKVELAALREQADSLRKQIRALNTTLVAAEGTPSVAAIETRLRLQDAIDKRARVSRRIIEIQAALAVLSEAWRANEAAKKALPEGTLSKSDQQKLNELEKRLRSQINEYGMSSINTNSMSINRDTYLPIHEGFNLTFDLSASDLIRTIWAYMNGLREVATQFSTHHLGLLVLDEPKQQSAAAESLAAFLKRTSQSKAANHQVIIATSETLQSLKPMLKGLPVKLIDFSSRVITAKGKK